MNYCYSGSRPEEDELLGHAGGAVRVVRRLHQHEARPSWILPKAG